jgi:hypothetical protein
MPSANSMAASFESDRPCLQKQKWNFKKAFNIIVQKNGSKKFLKKNLNLIAVQKNNYKKK